MVGSQMGQKCSIIEYIKNYSSVEHDTFYRNVIIIILYYFRLCLSELMLYETRNMLTSAKQLLLSHRGKVDQLLCAVIQIIWGEVYSLFRNNEIFQVDFLS